MLSIQQTWGGARIARNLRLTAIGREIVREADKKDDLMDAAKRAVLRELMQALLLGRTFKC